MNVDDRTKKLQEQIDELDSHLEAHKLLRDLWNELYSYHFKDQALLTRLQNYFDFDDSE